MGDTWAALTVAALERVAPGHTAVLTSWLRTGRAHHQGLGAPTSPCTEGRIQGRCPRSGTQGPREPLLGSAAPEACGLLQATPKLSEPAPRAGAPSTSPPRPRAPLCGGVNRTMLQQLPGTLRPRAWVSATAGREGPPLPPQRTGAAASCQNPLETREEQE